MHTYRRTIPRIGVIVLRNYEFQLFSTDTFSYNLHTRRYVHTERHTSRKKYIQLRNGFELFPSKKKVIAGLWWVFEWRTTKYTTFMNQCKGGI